MAVNPRGMHSQTGPKNMPTNQYAFLVQLLMSFRSPAGWTPAVTQMAGMSDNYVMDDICRVISPSQLLMRQVSDKRPESGSFPTCVVYAIYSNFIPPPPFPSIPSVPMATAAWPRGSAPPVQTGQCSIDIHLHKICAGFFALIAKSNLIPFNRQITIRPAGEETAGCPRKLPCAIGFRPG